MAVDIHSLTEKINSATQISTDIIDAMNSVAQAHMASDLAAALELAQRAADHAGAIDYPSGQATALIHSGTSLLRLHRFAEASSHYATALLIYEKLKDTHQAGLTLSKMGNAKLHHNKYIEALSYYDRAIDLLKDTDDELALANLYANSGLSHGLQGNYFLALKSQLTALKTYERLHDDIRIASTSTNIGAIYYEQQNYEEALKIYQRALDIRTAAGDHMSESVLLGNIGNVYQEQKKYQEALTVHLRALDIQEKLGDKNKLAYTYSNLGSAYKAVGEKTLALDYYNRSLALFLDLNEKRGLVQSYNNLGELYFELKEYKEAHHYLHEAITLAEETGWKIQLRIAYEYLSRLFAIEQNYQQAYDYQLRFSQVDREISNTETSGLIAQMTLRYEIEQREQAAEIERVKNIELQKAFNLLEQEKKRSEELLLNILPEEVSNELKEFGKTKARSYEMVTVLFMDIKGFTRISEQFTAEEIVSSIDEYFELFDLIVEKHGIEKIKTIGDAYLCVSGLPITILDHAEKMIFAARDFINAVLELKEQRISEGKHTFDFRVGIHSGPIVAGVVGIKKFAYDIWGDTVNTASRMQSNGEPNRINISHSTYQLIQDKFACTYRGEIEAKNKGKLKMYFVD